MKTKIYDIVKKLLEENIELRNSDKKLIWEVWRKLGLINNYGISIYITLDDFMKAPSTESIRRCRQKIQETHPELQASEEVKKLRKKKQASKSTFIYREEVKPKYEYNPLLGIMVEI